MTREPGDPPDDDDADSLYNRACLALWIFIVSFFVCLVRAGTFWYAAR